MTSGSSLQLNPQVAYDAAKEILTVGTYELLIKLGENAIDIVPKIEDLLLEYEQPIIQELALLLPIVSQYNDVKILINGESIYGKQADELDKSLAIVSLITTGVEKLVPIKEAINGATHLKRGASAMSLIHGLQQDYESIYQENN